jgi:hypothetical protein
VELEIHLQRHQAKAVMVAQGKADHRSEAVEVVVQEERALQVQVVVMVVLEYKAHHTLPLMVVLALVVPLPPDTLLVVVVAALKARPQEPVVLAAVEMENYP